MDALTVGSLFSGCLGLDLGLEAAGLQNSLVGGTRAGSSADRAMGFEPMTVAGSNPARPFKVPTMPMLSTLPVYLNGRDLGFQPSYEGSIPSTGFHARSVYPDG